MKIIHLIIVLPIILASCYLNSETQYDFKEYEIGGVHIPVHIGEETYDFQFDMGSSYSLISQTLYNKLGLHTTDSNLVFSGMRKTTSHYYQTEKQSFKIANIEMSEPFHYSTNTKNAIGINLIKQYYWMFDRSSKTFQLQDKPFRIENHSSDIVYKMKFHYNNIEVPIVDLLINDTISIPLLFDTGSASGQGYKKEDTAIVAYPTIQLNYYNHIDDNGFIRYIHSMFGNDALIYWTPSKFSLWLDSMTINNLPPTCFLMEVDVDSIYKKVNNGYIGALTWHFVRQFRTLYIDPKKQELTFIVSPGDSNIISRPKIDEGLKLREWRKLRHIKQ